jgi:hypothetical protein
MRALLKPVRAKISTAERLVEHVLFGQGIVKFIKQIDDGTHAAVVDFVGNVRMVRIAPEYWLTPIDAIILRRYLIDANGHWHEHKLWMAVDIAQGVFDADDKPGGRR